MVRIVAVTQYVARLIKLILVFFEDTVRSLLPMTVSHRILPGVRIKTVRSMQVLVRYTHRCAVMDDVSDCLTACTVRQQRPQADNLR